MPHLNRLSLSGYRGLARGQMPSFTNVNNTSIVTGVPPARHGISGNYFYDSASDREVMMNSAGFLRASTVFPAAQEAGRKAAVVTAKDKLRDIFANGLIELGGIAFSAERASQAGFGVRRLVAQPPPSSAGRRMFRSPRFAVILPAGKTGPCRGSTATGRSPKATTSHRTPNLSSIQPTENVREPAGVEITGRCFNRLV
jgi:phosphonoacetate hydrolase